MGRFQTRHTRAYVEFRERLDNDQLLNLRAHLINSLDDDAIPEQKLTVLEVGGQVRFHIYVDRVQAVVWLLGGHWLRHGEPSKAFSERMKAYAAALAQGREPGD